MKVSDLSGTLSAYKSLGWIALASLGLAGVVFFFKPFRSVTDVSAILSNSLSLSSILILTALGLSITFGVMRIINMAHGEMLMLGAYVAYMVEDPRGIPIAVENVGRIFGSEWRIEFGLHLNLFWAIPICFIVVGLVGYLLEACLIRFLYGRPLDTLLATWGVSLVIQQFVLLLFGANRQPMHMPEMLEGNWEVSGVNIPIYRLFIVGVTILCLFAVYWWFYRTSFGLKIRAVVQNRPMASALGISTRRVDAVTFAFATGLAGVAGCVLAHLYNVKYNMGFDYIVEAFMVVILGGMGQLAGSVGGGVLIGTGNSLMEKVLGDTSMAKVVVLVMVVAFILIRPSGLFASKERTYD